MRRRTCDWFSKTHGRVARLPSEAEWEYGARGGLRGRRYPNGDSISPREANYASSGAVKVAAYAPNGYGLYDMAGNVSEWVADWYDPGVLSGLAGQEPARSGNSRQRAAAARRFGAAGGAWTSKGCVSPPDMLVPGRGTRVVRPTVWAFAS